MWIPDDPRFEQGLSEERLGCGLSEAELRLSASSESSPSSESLKNVVFINAISNIFRVTACIIEVAA